MKIKMNINLITIKELLSDNFNGNQSEMARAFGVTKEHVNLVLNTGRGAGSVFCGGIMRYCEKNKLNYKNYIFFK
jgi:hypothetical protein